MRWPNLFVPGVPKAGTTSLSEVKEPHFFSEIKPERRLVPFFPSISETNEYLALFARSEGCQWWGEASSSYFWDRNAPARISRVSPAAKFVVIVRDPVERAFSHYLNDLREGHERRSFRAAIEDELSRDKHEIGWGRSPLYVECGYYTDSLRRYWDTFGREGVMLLVFEEFVQNPRSALEGVYSFLGVDTEFARQVAVEALNRYQAPRNSLAQRMIGNPTLRRSGQTLVPRAVRAFARRLLLKTQPKPEMRESDRSFLRSLFEADVADLQQLTGRQFPWLQTDVGALG